MLKGKGKIYRSGTAYTMFASIPADVVKDGTFPFDRKKTTDITVKIEGNKLIIEKT